jgi:predicted dehydrogenase
MTIRVAVVGAGAWGANHARVLAGEPDCELAAIVDPDAQARARVIAAFAPRARPAASLEDVLSTVDAVVISAPSPTHADLAVQVLASGKHVLVEKPLALSLRDAERVAVAATAHTVAMVGHLMVHHPAVARLGELLAGGELGPIRYIHATRANLGVVRRDEDVLWSLGPHDLSMLDALLGGRQPINVSARGQCVLMPGIADVVFLALRYADGMLAHLHLSWLHPKKERRLTVVGAHKLAELDDVAPEKLRIHAKGYDRPPEFTQFAEYLTIRDGDVHIPRIAMVEPLRVELRQFLDCIATDARPTTDVTSAVRVVAILDAAARSLASDGVPVALGA